jgi:glycosyltransferase involved in cell wall biosynthesis
VAPKKPGRTSRLGIGCRDRGLASAGAVSAALARLLADPELLARLGRAGIETAQEYAWEQRIDALEAFFQRVAASRRMALAGELAPSLVWS